MKTHPLIACSVVALAFTCSSEPLHAGPPKYTEDDVRKFVLPGTSREAIVEKFGEPDHDEKNPKFEDGSKAVDEIIYYDLRPTPIGDYVFSGFQVRLKNGKALVWFSSHSTTK